MKEVLQEARFYLRSMNKKALLAVTRELLNSNLFYAFELFAACVFVFTGTEVEGAVCFVMLICIELLVCDDILPTLLPFLLISAFTTNCYDSFDLFFPYIRYVPVAALCLGYHFVAYRQPMKTGESSYGIIAVSIAVLSGGIGNFTLKEYATGAYYLLGLSVGMLAAYYLMKSQFSVRRDYDLRERFSVIMTVLGLLCVFMIASGYYKNHLGLTKPPYILGFSRNNLSTLLMFAMPFPLFLAKKNPYLALLTPVLYGAITVSTSRGGLLFGSMEVLICCVYWSFSGKNRIWRAAVCFTALAVVLLVFKNVIVDVIYDRFLADDKITGDDRYKMMLEAVEKFKKNPLVGFGILDDDIAYGAYKKKGSMAWYHMMLPQIVGSMGLLGIAAYGFQFVGRVKLIFEKRTLWSLCLGISYFGILSMSQVNPGEFCPLPFELLTVLLFILQEKRLEKPRLPLSERAPVKQ